MTFQIVTHGISSYGMEYKRNLNSCQRRKGIGGSWWTMASRTGHWLRYHPTQMWIEFYVDGEEDPAFVFWSVTDFAASCMQFYNFKFPLPIRCFTVGTHLWCLREWEHLLGEMACFFHEVKVIHINRGPKRDGGKEEIIFYGKVATLSWDAQYWHWIDGGRFLNYTTKDGSEFIINMNLGTTRAEYKWQGYLLRNFRF